eukprot:4586117-Lingulodinium_polyedra.AAC.1
MAAAATVATELNDKKLLDQLALLANVVQLLGAVDGARKHAYAVAKMEDMRLSDGSPASRYVLA